MCIAFLRSKCVFLLNGSKIQPGRTTCQATWSCIYKRSEPVTAFLPGT